MGRLFLSLILRVAVGHLLLLLAIHSSKQSPPITAPIIEEAATPPRSSVAPVVPPSLAQEAEQSRFDFVGLCPGEWIMLLQA